MCFCQMTPPYPTSAQAKPDSLSLPCICEVSAKLLKTSQILALISNGKSNQTKINA